MIFPVSHTHPGIRWCSFEIWCFAHWMNAGQASSSRYFSGSGPAPSGRHFTGTGCTSDRHFSGERLMRNPVTAAPVSRVLGVPGYTHGTPKRLEAGAAVTGLMQHQFFTAEVPVRCTTSASEVPARGCWSTAAEIPGWWCLSGVHPVNETPYFKTTPLNSGVCMRNRKYHYNKHVYNWQKIQNKNKTRWTAQRVRNVQVHIYIWAESSTAREYVRAKKRKSVNNIWRRKKR